MVNDLQIKSFVKEICDLHKSLNNLFFDGMLRNSNFHFDFKEKNSIVWSGKFQMFLIGNQIKFEFLIEDLIHNMIHSYNEQINVIDVVKQYHNKNFSNKAIELGFYVIKHRTQGWGLITQNYPRNVIIVSNIKIPKKSKIEERISLLKNLQYNKVLVENFCNSLQQPKPSKTFFFKWVCGCPDPHNSIRCGRKPNGKNGLDATCNVCQQKFVCVSNFEDLD